MSQKYICGVVVGHRIGENRGCGRSGIACIGGCIEVNVGDRIDLARQWRMRDPWKPGFRQYGVTEWRNGLLTKDFSCVFYSQVSGEEACRASAQAGTPQFIMGASFGEAAFANMSKGKAYLIFL